MDGQGRLESERFAISIFVNDVPLGGADQVDLLTVLSITAATEATRDLGLSKTAPARATFGTGIRQRSHTAGQSLTLFVIGGRS